MNLSLARGDVGEAVRAEDRGHGNERVVPQMHQEAGKNAAGARAHQREDNADENEHGDKTPGPPQLRAVHQAEKDPCQDNAAEDAASQGRCVLDAKETQESGYQTSEERIKISAEERLLHQRRHEHRHSDEEQRGLPMLKQFLHGDVLRLLHARREKSNEKRQPGAGNEINKRVSGLFATVRVDLAPAETLPERVPAQEGQRNIEEEEDGGVPDEHAADGKLRLGDEVLLHLLGSEFLAVWQIVDPRMPCTITRLTKPKRTKQMPWIHDQVICKSSGY